MGETIRTRERDAIEAYDRGEYETAVAAFMETRQVWQQLGDPRGEASALSDLGVAHQKMGNWADAQHAYQEALALYQTLDDPQGEAVVMGNLATLLKRRGAADQAESLLKEAVEMFYALGKRDHEADSLRMLAQLQLQRGGWLDALLSYHRAMSRMEQLSGSQRLLRLLTTLFLRIVGARNL